MNKRRTFLGYLTSTALVPLIPARAGAARRLPATDAEPVIRVLQEILPDNPATKRLGALALRQYDDDFASRGLPSRLTEPFNNSSPPTADQLRTHLQALRDADFAAGNTVTLDGWILARSEAEALAASTLYREG